MARRILIALIGLVLVGCVGGDARTDGQVSAIPVATFDWFEYRGADPILDTPRTDDEFINPVLTGFYPDPSVVRVGEDYYMTNSTFGFYPGLPVFHSRDLVSWVQIGNALDRPDMMSFDGIHPGWNGLYAPTIDYHDGLFYLINTCIACGGDFILTAEDPAGPWSDPIWIGDLADSRGIDPQMFWENDRLFILNHENPEGEMLYDGHRAIWIREVHPETFEIIGKKKMIIDGGVNHQVAKPGYVEGPHLYKVGKYYYLSAPEGGTGMEHRQTIWRAEDIFGPYVPYENNPILTQRGLPDDRPNPITSTGHADMVETQNGEWWAVFLGTRTYDAIHFATGRETFLLPVTWTDDGWPVILEQGKEVPYVLGRPNLPKDPRPSRPVAGNFTIRADFNGALENYWSFVRIPSDPWWAVESGGLSITARDDRIGDGGQPSFVGRRLHHINSTATTKMMFTPKHVGDEAGLMALQNDEFYYAFGLGQRADGETVLRVRQRDGGDVPVAGRTVKEVPIDVDAGEAHYLQITVDGPTVDFAYSQNGSDFTAVAEDLDGKMLGSMKSGGFTGAFVGMYAETGEVRKDEGVNAADLPAGVVAPPMAFTRAYGSGQTNGIVGAPGLPDEQALQIAVQGGQPNVWDAGVSAANLPGGFDQGDQLTLKFWARRLGGPGTISAGIQQADPPYTVAISKALTLSDTWQEYTIDGYAAIGLAPDEAAVVVHAGHAAQTLEFGQFEVQKTPSQ